MRRCRRFSASPASLDDGAVSVLSAISRWLSAALRRETGLSDRLSTILPMLTTDQKGVVAEMAIAHAALELGVGVSRPLGDQRYDLIFDFGAKLLRVQCKWASRHGDVVIVRCYSARRNADGARPTVV